jgi:hypothetical protein
VAQGEDRPIAHDAASATNGQLSDSAPLAGTPDQPFPVAELQGRGFFLRPLGQGDYVLLRAAENSTELGVRWRGRGSVLSPDQWAQSLWQGRLAQMIVALERDGRPLGLVQLYSANFQDGHASVGAMSFGATSGTPLMMFGLALFLDHVFTCWNFHKLYMEVAEYNMPQFASAIDRLVVQEGRLGKHYWYGGRHWDQLLLALYRDDWFEKGRGLVRAARRPAQRVVQIRMPQR